jgi:hypothetical protein
VAFGIQNITPHLEEWHLGFKTSLHTVRSVVPFWKHHSTPGEVLSRFETSLHIHPEVPSLVIYY